MDGCNGAALTVPAMEYSIHIYSTIVKQPGASTNVIKSNNRILPQFWLGVSNCIDTNEACNTNKYVTVCMYYVCYISTVCSVNTVN